MPDYLLHLSCGHPCETRNPTLDNHEHEQQFKILAEKVLTDPALADSPRFATNDARVKNRRELVRIITDVLMQNDREHWLELLTGLGCV